MTRLWQTHETSSVWFHGGSVPCTTACPHTCLSYSILLSHRLSFLNSEKTNRIESFLLFPGWALGTAPAPLDLPGESIADALPYPQAPG